MNLKTSKFKKQRMLISTKINYALISFLDLFSIAILCAFTAKSTFPISAYTSKLDIPTQISFCQYRGTCSGNGPICQIEINGNNFQLYELDGFVCAGYLTGYFIPGEESEN